MKLVLVAIVAVGAIVGLKVVHDQRLQAEDQAHMVKSDAELIGEHLYLQREGKDPVDINLYRIDDGQPHSLVINIHGGAFIAGDADALDTQSDRISNAWGAHVATVNYRLMDADHPKQYAVEEIVDTAAYFIDHGDEFGVDPGRIFLLGYSAGGYHAMAAALQLHEAGVDIAGQIVCYGFLGDVMEQFDALSDAQKSSVPPALFVLAGDEPIGKASLEYQAALEACGVDAEVLVVDGALHGFIEENNPEYANLHSHTSMSPEQEAMAREAEDAIGAWIAQH